MQKSPKEIDTPTLKAEWHRLYADLLKAAPADREAIQSQLDDLDEEPEFRRGGGNC
jgi:hypothetical protein